MVDFEDLKNILCFKGKIIGFNQVLNKSKALHKIKKLKIKQAKYIYIYFVVNPNMFLLDLCEIINKVEKNCNEEVKIIWDYELNEFYKNKFKMCLLAVGI
ncbi:hypothetical protein [Campylobacter ureolyticus]|uniref:hypothetical protein n=1 Tax=Campylobacter ureolyticus TaxID=827 RepID=UPI0022B39403|nr:hypothetical protein [Campylobacter ureolyticus]MCZ6174536.1 hypothetical protein [Campylobacter ureolyticus]